MFVVKVDVLGIVEDDELLESVVVDDDVLELSCVRVSVKSTKTKQRLFILRVSSIRSFLGRLSVTAAIKSALSIFLETRSWNRRVSIWLCFI